MTLKISGKFSWRFFILGIDNYPCQCYLVFDK